MPSFDEPGQLPERQRALHEAQMRAERLRRERELADRVSVEALLWPGLVEPGETTAKGT